MGDEMKPRAVANRPLAPLRPKSHRNLGYIQSSALANELHLHRRHSEISQMKMGRRPSRLPCRWTAVGSGSHIFFRKHLVSFGLPLNADGMGWRIYIRLASSISRNVFPHPLPVPPTRFELLPSLRLVYGYQNKWMQSGSMYLIRKRVRIPVNPCRTAGDRSSLYWPLGCLWKRGWRSNTMHLRG